MFPVTRALARVALPALPALPVLAAVAGLPALAACDSLFTTAATTNTLPSVTGLEIRAESVLVSHGCGRSADDVFVWGGVVRAEGSAAPLATHVVDCFADLVFHELPAGDGGIARFTVELVAFNESDWARVDAASRAALRAGSVGEVASLPATWRSSCTAMQEPGFRREAICAPFGAATDGGSTGSTAPDANTSDADPSDAGAFDAGTPDANPSDAGTAAPPAGDADPADGATADAASTDAT